MNGLAVALALGAAALFAIGAAAQQKAAAINVGAGGLRLMLRLLRSPRWLAATFGNALGYTLQAAALSSGSLLIVQPLLVTSLVFALPLGARWNHRRLSRREIGWAVALCLALATFILASHADGGVDVAPLSDWLPAIVTCGVIVVGIGLMASVASGLPRALGFAIVAGTCVGLASALTKSAVHLLGEGPDVLVSHWELYVLIAAGGLGIVSQQLAFQSGSLEISFPATIVLDPVVSVLVGIAALDERVHPSGIEVVLIAASTALLLAGTIALGRAAAPTVAPGAEPEPVIVPI